MRYSFAKADGNYTVKARANNVGWRDQEYFASYERTGKLSRGRELGQIPQFYSVDTRTRIQPAAGRWCSPTRRSGRSRPAPANSSLRPDRAAVRCSSGATWAASTVAPRRRDLDVTTGFAMQEHGGELPGRQFRLQQRRRGAAALRLARERLHDRHRVDEYPRHRFASPTADRDSTTSPIRSCRTARCGSTTGQPGRAACPSRRRTRRRRSASAGTRG